MMDLNCLIKKETNSLFGFYNNVWELYHILKKDLMIMDLVKV